MKRQSLSHTDMQPPHRSGLSIASVTLTLLIIPIVFTAAWYYTGLHPFGWDAAWYRNVVNDGYRFDGNILRQQNVAFLPGYPLLISLTHWLTKTTVEWSQYTTSTACYIAGSYCLYKAFCFWFSARQSALAILIFSLNPFAIYLFNGYSEALFYLLCSVFFLGIATDKLWLASVALSFALVTRPHAVSLYPVLFYKLVKNHWPIVSSTNDWKTKRLHTMEFLCVGIDQVFLTLIFPIVLTIYWYIKFSDPLVYSNAITAWSGVGTSGISGQLKFLFQHTTHFYAIARLEIAGFPIVIASPGNVASVNVLANILALLYLIRQKRFEVALFCVSLLAFWFLKSVPGDSGRHALMLLALPIALSSILLQPTPALLPVNREGRIKVFRFWLVRIFVIGFLLLNFEHFCAFALLQLRGGWIS